MKKEEIILNDIGNPNGLSVTIWKLDKWWEKTIYCIGYIIAVFAIAGWVVNIAVLLIATGASI